MFQMTPKQSLRGQCFAMLCTAVLSLGLTTVRATADQWDKKTVVTFNMPVEVPGKVLPAGTYVIRLLNSPSNRHIVQIYNASEKKLLATVLAVPDYRLKPSAKPVVRFEERPSGQPEAVEAFFYPGDNFGQQFVYPHHRAVELAKRTNHNVLAMPDSMSKSMAMGAKTPDDANAKALENTEVSAVNPQGSDVDLLIVIEDKPEN